MKKKALTSTFASLGAVLLLMSPVYTNSVRAVSVTSTSASSPAKSSSVSSVSSKPTTVASSSKATSQSTAVPTKVTVTNDGTKLVATITASATKMATLKNFKVTCENQNLVFNFNATKDGVVPILLNNKTVGTGTISGADTQIKAEISLAKAGLNNQGGKNLQVAVDNVNATTKLAGTATGSADASSSSSAQSSSATSKSESKASTAASKSSDAVSQAMKATRSQASKKKSLANNNNVHGSMGITIDGKFHDWDDITKSAMTINGDNDNIKYAALVADSENIYFYVLMNPVLSGGYTSFQPAGYDLTVGGKEFWITFNNGQTVNLDEGQSQMVSTNIYSSDANVNLNGQAAVGKQSIDQTMGDGKKVKGIGYVFECAIPLKDLKGISDISDQTITLKNRNLWDGEIDTTGGSTGPVLLAGTGFAIAGWSVLQVLRRKQKVE
jgi:uncharacterized protein (TIGR04145 family)